MKLDILELTFPLAREQQILKFLQIEKDQILIHRQSDEEELFLVFLIYPGKAYRRETLALLRDPEIFAEFKSARMVYQITTSTNSIGDLLRTFPLTEGDEWFECTAQTGYLCLSNVHLSPQQLTWLALCPFIRDWKSEVLLSDPFPCRSAG